MSHITITWHGDQFNVDLSSKAGGEPFLQVKGCRIVNGSNGEFVSWPATKNASTGKWWNHCYGSEAFNAAVLEKAKQAAPAKAPARRQAASGGGGGGDMEDIPFSRAGCGLAAQPG